MTQITPQGFLRTRLHERLEQLKTAMRAIFGQDIHLEPDTLDGQTLGIFAGSLSNLDQLAEAIYHGFNPQTATGTALSRLVQLNGIRRLAGSRSTVELACVGNPGTLIPLGSLVRSTATRAVFATLADIRMDSTGKAKVMAQAVEPGLQWAPAGTLTSMDTPLWGWQSVSNPLDAVPGRLEETDEQLRIRRARSTSTPAQSVVDAIYGALANLPEVRQCRLYENDQDSLQPETGLPPHSIYAVLEGGRADAIVQTLWLKKTAGTTTVGSVEGTAIDSLGNPHVLRFARPKPVLVYIIVHLQTYAGWPADGAQRIVDALLAFAAREQGIGQALLFSRLFSPLNTVPDHAVESLSIGIAANPTGTANIAVPFDGIIRFEAHAISVHVA